MATSDRVPRTWGAVRPDSSLPLQYDCILPACVFAIWNGGTRRRIAAGRSCPHACTRVHQVTVLKLTAISWRSECNRGIDPTPRPPLHRKAFYAHCLTVRQLRRSNRVYLVQPGICRNCPPDTAGIICETVARSCPVWHKPAFCPNFISTSVQAGSFLYPRREGLAASA